MLGSMPERMVGAALLKVDTFEDVEHDRSATLQAALIVVLSAISGGVGSLMIIPEPAWSTRCYSAY